MKRQPQLEEAINEAGNAVEDAHRAQRLYENWLRRVERERVKEGKRGRQLAMRHKP